jgi:hypothetical protein
MKKLKKFTIEALRREMPVLEEMEERGIVGGSGYNYGGSGGGADSTNIWIPFSGNYMDYLSDYVTNTPDSTYVERVVFVLKNGTAIAYQDSLATDSSTVIRYTQSGANGQLYLPFYKDSAQYNSPIDSIIHTHKTNSAPSGADSAGHISGVGNFIFYNGTLVPY